MRKVNKNLVVNVKFELKQVDIQSTMSTFENHKSY